MKLTKKILAVVLAALTLFSVFSFAACSGSPKGLAKKYVKASFNGDYKTMVNMIHPKVLEYLLDKYEVDKSDLMKYCKEAQEDYKEELKENKIKFKKVEIKDADPMKNSEVKDIAKSWEDIEDLDVELTDITTVSYKAYWKDGSSNESDRGEMKFYKINGKWCLGLSASESIVALLVNGYGK